jgi:hypothetical protein
MLQRISEKLKDTKKRLDDFIVKYEDQLEIEQLIELHKIYNLLDDVVD